MKVGGQVTVIVWTAVAAAAMLTCMADGRRVDVGGKDGWTQGINYTLWASQQNFYVGDWLFFRFNKYTYDVLEVNQKNYENCNADHFIKNITQGSGRDVVELKEAKPYYFICSKGYCYGGMKLAVNVTQPSPPSAAPQGNHAASLFQPGDKSYNFPVLVVAMLVLAFVFTV
ncbi:hypothetical protein Cgig2_000579 [Carnegiea gigantea]|uniref:Phytocyanin domain-containing protein n=1 Tax=Carnegiea gigantea TaxID=171969 RepID=A0A9Q1GWB6_9CARY|nr:hypothetical protein Cgig2_000579 [Carnegiea gigantea]